LVYVSAVSAWELSSKASLGKLRAPDDLEAQLRASQFSQLPVSIAHAIAAGDLPRYHGDPFDQAALESLTLLTSDERLRAYDVQIMIV